MGAVVRHEARRRPVDEGQPLECAPPARSQTLVFGCALSVAAGAIHAVAMVDHLDHYWLYGAFFLVVTYFQILWAVWVYRHPADRRVLLAGGAVSLAISAVWLVSRTVGVPVGPDAGIPERIGAMDVMAMLDQLVLAGVVYGIVWPDRWLGRRAARIADAAAVRLGIMLCSASLLAMLLGSHHH